jgi:hypothetical protein
MIGIPLTGVRSPESPERSFVYSAPANAPPRSGIRAATRLAAALAVALSTGCPGFGDKTLSDFVNSTGTPTWENGVRDFMATHCVSCHQNPPQEEAPEGFRFDKYDRQEGGDGLLGAYEMSIAIQIRVVEEGSMPPLAPLDAEGRAFLAEWIEAGSPRDDSDLPRRSHP